MIEIYRQVRQIITPEEHRRLLLLTIPVCLFALLNVVGVGVVVPFIAVAANPSVIHQNVWLERVYQGLHFHSSQHFLIFLGLLAFTMLFVVNAGNAFLVWLNAKVSNDLGVSLGKRLLTTYLYQPYAFFLNQNSANMSNRLLRMVDEVKTGVVFNGVNFCSSVLVITSLSVLLLAVNFRVGILAIVVVGVVYFGIYWMVKKRLRKISEDQSVQSQRSFKSISEAFGGIKDLSLMGQQDFFLRQYVSAASVLNHNTATITCIQGIPRYVFELLAFGGVLLLIVACLASGQTMGQLLPLLSMFIYAGYRLLPASQAMMNAYSNLKVNQATLAVLHQDFSELSKQQLPMLDNSTFPLSFTRSIRLDAVGFAYPNAGSNVLDSITLAIHVNQVVGIIGPTGAGKTTLVDILLGLLRPTEGQLCVDDRALVGHDLQAWQRQLGYVSQHIYLSDDTVTNNIAFGVDPKAIDQAQVERAAKAAAIHSFICNDLSNGYDTEIGERGVRLSGGQRQRIGIARALYHNPSVLVLDEATSALDGATESAVMDAIHALARRKTIIIIAHRLTTVSQCDTVFLIDKGRVVDQGAFSELLDKHPAVQEMAALDV